MLIKAWKPSINREGVCFGQPPIQQVRVETGGWVQLLDSVTPCLLPSHHLVYDGVGWPAAFQAPGLSPSHFGSSGTLLRYSSRVCLNRSRLLFLDFSHFQAGSSTIVGHSFGNFAASVFVLWRFLSILGSGRFSLSFRQKIKNVLFAFLCVFTKFI